MPSEVSQTEKDKYHVISLTCEMQKQKQNQKNKLIDTEIGCQRQGAGGEGAGGQNG